MILPRFVFVNVHFTVSPGSSLNVAVRVPTLLVLGVVLAPSSQEMLVRSKPGVGSLSIEVYVPGARLFTTIWPPSEMEPAASPVNVKLPAAPSGLVCFSTMILPRLVFVKVHVTTSPADRWIELGSSAGSPLLDVHVAVVT